jgi:hypothetical protein
MDEIVLHRTCSVLLKHVVLYIQILKKYMWKYILGRVLFGSLKKHFLLEVVCISQIDVYLFRTVSISGFILTERTKMHPWSKASAALDK